MSLRAKYILAVFVALIVAAAGLVFWHRLAVLPALKTVTFRVVATVALIAALVAVLLGAYHLFVGRPMRRIIDGAKHLASGDHTHRIELAAGDELSAIANVINRMAENMASAKLELENQVAERTEDLRAVLEEVHERSRIAEEVNRRLEEADHRKTEFLTNVSHELRTPLNSIVGYVRLLQDGMYESEAERQEFLENTRQSAAHLLHLVTGVLSAAQIEAGSLTVEREALHPGDALHEALRLMNVHFREKELSVMLEVDGDLMVLADAAKLRQVLLNLISNAVKFTDDGFVTLRAKASEDGVRFEVEDTGEGIPAEDLERIFEKFHQVHTRGARHAGGTGLGLAICRELVTLMDGRIGAYSAGPGQGSLFHFTLPAVATGVAEAATA